MASSIVKRGSVVLIRYPFTDLPGAKVRPALVLTPDHLLPRLEDVLCLFSSSVMPEELLPTDFVLELGHASFLNTGLRRRSVLRMHQLALLHKALVLRVLGESWRTRQTDRKRACRSMPQDNRWWWVEHRLRSLPL